MSHDADLRRRYAAARRAVPPSGVRSVDIWRRDLTASRTRTDELLARVRASRERRGDSVIDEIRDRRRFSAGRRPIFASSGRHSRERSGAWSDFLRGRPRADLQVADNVAGGFLAPPNFVQEMLRNLVLFSPIRDIARVAQTDQGQVLLPRRTGAMTATWRQRENDAATETQPTYGQISLEAGELAAYIDVSNRIFEDAAFDLEAELALDFAEEFGRAESEAFVKGDGVSQPLGLTKTSEIDTVITGDAGGFPDTDPADVLIKLFHALPSAYAANATWAMNRSTMETVRKFKLGDGQYLLQPGLSSEYPATILGRPVVEFPDMDDVASNQMPIVFGDFNAGFRIYDRVQLSVMRDPYTVQKDGLIRFHGRRRVAGGVVRGEAFKLLKVAAP